MKDRDDLFKHMFERKFYGGSYYDGIKVGKPEEYDLDFVLKLPLLAEPQVEVSDKNGFVHIRIKEYVKLLKQPEGKKFDKLDSLMDEGNYLSTQKTLQWMEKIMILALNDNEKDKEGIYFKVEIIGNDEPVKIYANLVKAHPAFTLKLKSDDGSINFDVDLVPCFQFTNANWPKGDYRPNPSTTKNKFLVVPKKPHGSTPSQDIGKYWRLSFQEQERDLLKGDVYNKMKPSIKLLKLLRDKYNHNIASYFIKTVFLWEVGKNDVAFWSQPLSLVFIQMLQKYAEYIENKCIPYYWNEKFNLIGHLKEATLNGIGNCLKRIIKDVKGNLEDPFRIAKYLVGPDQVDMLKSEVTLGKKALKQISNVLDTSISSTEDSVDEVDTSRRETTTTPSFSDKLASTPNVCHLRKSLTASSDRLAEVIEELYQQNLELRESNKDILKICDNLRERVTSLEKNVVYLTSKNAILTSQLNRSHNSFEGDRLSLSASYIQLRQANFREFN
ncbi:hypothetical protein JTB14_006120 [Gonioctena quinquepunctata]|nr:hypothetical protein JTB14_006120 [Gonioctena quinquepunctata]